MVPQGRDRLEAPRWDCHPHGRTDIGAALSFRLGSVPMRLRILLALLALAVPACSPADLGDDPIGAPSDQTFSSLEALTGSAAYRFTSSVSVDAGGTSETITITGDVQDRDHFRLVYEPSGVEVIGTFDGYWERNGDRWEPADPRFERGQFEPPTSYQEAALELSGVVDQLLFTGNEVVGDGFETAHWRVEDGNAFVDMWIDARGVMVKAEWFDTIATYLWEMRDIGDRISVETPEA